MESDESKWLKSRYQEAATDGPAPKRVKFDSIKEEMLAEFPHKSLSALNIHRFIEESFPNSFAKRLGHSRHTHVFGICRKAEAAGAAFCRYRDVCNLIPKPAPARD